METNNLQSTTELDNNTLSNSSKKTGHKKKPVKKTGVKKSASQRPAFIQTAPIGAPLNDDSRANRPVRVPVGSRRRLSVPQRPGFVRYWVVDKDARLQMFDRAGYTIVSDENLPIGDQCSKDSNPLGATRRMSVGRGRYAYLMEIPEHLYKEDQANKIKKNTEAQQKAMRPADIEGNRYGSIDIKRNEHSQG